MNLAVSLSICCCTIALPIWPIAAAKTTTMSGTKKTANHWPGLVTG